MPEPSRPLPSSARVDLGQPRSNNAAASALDIAHALAPLSANLTACYRDAVAASPDTPGAGSSTLHLETDDEGYVVLARVTGPAPASAARCIESLAQRRVRIPVDTGTADADVPLLFRVQ